MVESSVTTVKQPTKVKYYLGTGRRKTAVARIAIKRGIGRILVNGKPLNDYFVREADRIVVLAPLKAAKATTRYNLRATINGGGFSGQAGAVSLGIARALVATDPKTEKLLRAEGLLTRDSRMKERKKYGQRGARAKFQFSKR